MHFPFLKPQKLKGESVLLIRIGEESIDFAFCKDVGDNVEVLAYGTKEIQSFSVESSLNELFHQTKRSAPIKKVIVTFSPSVFKAAVSKTLFSRNAPFKSMNDQESRFIEKTVFEQAEEKTRKSLTQSSGILSGDFQSNSMEILTRRIDGYPVWRLQGFKGTSVELVILQTYLLLTPARLLQKISRKQGMPSITVLHLAQALERFARKKRKNGVYLHIAEESSEIAIWKDGVFALTEAIPLGGTHFTKVFENVLGMRKNTAQEFQERYFAGKLSEELRSQIKTLLAPPLNDFAALVKERLFQLNMSLPENIWIFGKGCKVREIFEMFEDDRVEKDLPFSQKPQPAFLLPKDIWNLERFPKNADPSYTGLFLLGYAEHAREEKGY